MSAYGLSYSNYNTIIVVLLPTIAFILNVLTFVGAKRLGLHADMKKELKLIRTTLIITFVDVLFITCPNIVIGGSYNKYWTMPGATTLYLYVFFCCNSAINLFVYICLKRDFRNHLLMALSIGALRSHLKLTNEVTPTPFKRASIRVAPTTASNVTSPTARAITNVSTGNWVLIWSLLASTVYSLLCLA